MVASGSDDKTIRLWYTATALESQAHRTLKPVSTIAFSDDGTSLKTDAGRFDLGTVFSTHGKPAINSQCTLDVESSWIKHHGTELVWLPHEYRASCHGAFGSILVIGHASGAVSSISAI
jgi:WD40 repeat protein